MIMIRNIKNIYRRFILIYKSRILKKRIKIGKNVNIQGVKNIQVGDNFNLGEQSKILCWEKYDSGLSSQSLVPLIRIGRNFRATRNFTIQCAGSITIGNDVLVASDVFIVDYNHCTNPLFDNYLDGELEVGEVCIGDGVWIGNNVIILPNVHIGKKAIIGAGSVVTNDIDDYCIAAGNPAKILKRWNFDKNEWENISVKETV